MNDSSLAYEQLIAPLEQRMIRSVWRITRNSHDADDALQNALLTICKRWDRVVRHPTPSALVLKICVDAAYDVLRRQLRDKQKLRSAASIGAASTSAASISKAVDHRPGPPYTTTAHDFSDEVLAALRSLSRSQAVAVVLRICEELSYEEIASAMACSQATVRKHVERGRSRLRIALAHHQGNELQGDPHER